MKELGKIALIMILILPMALAFTACDEEPLPDPPPGGGTIEGLYMVVEFESYPNDVQTINVTWVNNTFMTLTFGDLFYIEQKVDDVWCNAFPEKHVDFNSVGYMCRASSQTSHSYSIANYTDYLESGTYRIATNASYLWPDFVYLLYGEFVVE